MSNQAYNEIYGSRPEGATMASGEPSAASMLDQMRDRLNSLSDEARTIRAQMPQQYEPDVERIQQQMQRLGERLSDLSRGALVPYDVMQRASERRVKEVRYVTEDDVRVGRARPDQIIPLGSPLGVRRADPAQDANSWDEAAASALVSLYESGEAYGSSYARHETSMAASVRPSPRAVASRTTERPMYAATPGSSSGAMSTAQQGQRACAMDEGVLDRRFAEIATRIEQSLSQIRPEAALNTIGSRFDQLEAQITAIVSQMATRADLKELRLAEEQIDEIASQLDQFRRQMARLDMIDAHLGTLTEHLSDERLRRIFNEGVHISADIGRLDAIDAQLRMIAVQLSDERLSGLVSRSASRDVDYEEVAHYAAQRVMAASISENQGRDSHARDIGEVRGMLENLINERRHHDENNASMLETMQQALIRVLDRIDSIEIAQQPAAEPAPVYHQAPAASYEQPAPVMPPMQPMNPAPMAQAAPPASPAPSLSSRISAATYDDLIPATATVYAEMPSAEIGEASDFLPPLETEADADLQAFHQDIAAEQPPRIPVYTTSSFNLDEAFSSARDAEAPSFGEPQPEKRSMEVLRHDFIADAHRAKLKAASKPDLAADSDMRAGELSVGPRETAKPRRRSIFSFRSQRVAMSLLILLAAVPAAIFFMPRTEVARMDVPAPAAITHPAKVSTDALPAEPSEAEPTAPAVPRAPAVVPPLNAPSKQTRQEGPAVEPRGNAEFEDASSAGAQIDTASLPDGIMMQPAVATGAQVAQMSDQAHMAYLSGQLGIAAAKATPASLMEQQLLRESGVPAADAANGQAKLPPAMVGPYSMRLAAAQGDASAQFEVASRLAEGKGTDQDLAEAAQWYQRSASQGFALAQFRLGTLYERGLGVKPDAQRAQVWYERAAAQGNVKAMHNLAVLIASRAGKADYEAAVRWFTTAANFGLADSQYNLAMLYENGMGVEKNPQQAYKWLILAAKSGDKDAAARRDALKAKLSAEQVSAATAEVADWRAKPITGMANDARLAGQAWRGANGRG